MARKEKLTRVNDGNRSLNPKLLFKPFRNIIYEKTPKYSEFPH